MAGKVIPLVIEVRNVEGWQTAFVDLGDFKRELCRMPAGAPCRAEFQALAIALLSQGIKEATGKEPIVTGVSVVDQRDG